jgi:multiple sugar transport system substrate-binding protein
MNLMKTSIRMILLLMALSLLLGACLASPALQDLPDEKDTGEGESVTLRIATGDSGEGLTPHQAIIDHYIQTNPSTSILLDPVSGDYYAVLLSSLESDQPPDLLQIGDDAVPNFVSHEAIIPLDKCIKDNNLNLTGYLPGLLDPGKESGEQYLLPKDYSPIGVFYNKKLFDQAGLDYPKENWTWEELLATAQKLTQDLDGDGTPDIWGIQLPANWTSGFEFWVAAAGGSLVSPDGKKAVAYMDSPATIRAVKFYADLYNQYRVAPPPVDLTQFGGGNTEFRQGKAAMWLTGRWPQSDLKKLEAIDLGVAPPPSDVQRANILFWSGFGISSASKNPDQACKFLIYYTGNPGSEIWKYWALPAVRSVAETSGQIADPIDGVWIRELNYLVPRTYTFTPYWNEAIQPALNEALITMISDPNADPTTVMQQAAQKAQTTLDELNQ